MKTSSKQINRLPLKKWLRNLFINIAVMTTTFILLFVFTEIGFRLYLNIIKSRTKEHVVKMIPDATLGYRMQPGYDGKYKINSYGFRDREYSLTKPENTFRIVNIGDSVTKGLGLKLENVYNKVLEKRLNETFNSRITYEVLNMGIGGYNTIQEYLLLKDSGLKFHPDFVLLQLFYNDSDPTNVLDKYGFLTKDLDTRKWTDLSLRDWLKKSKFAKFVKITVFQKVFHKNLNAIPHYMNSRVQDKGWATMKEYLNKINLLCASHNTKFAIVNFPNGFQIGFGEKDWVLQHDIQDFCNVNKILFLDLTPVFASHIGEELFVMDNQHPSWIGGEIAAEAIFNFLINNNIIPPDVSTKEGL